MAVFIPAARPDDFNGSFGEMAVYDALKQLDDNYTVFYSLSWVGAKDNISVGEADFVVAHPSKGILVIEVKAGEIEYVNGEWHQINSKSRVTKRIEPFVQARKSQFEIMDRLHKNIKNFRLPMFCYAVWFTSVDIPDKEMLPMESPKEIVLDISDLDSPEKSIEEVFDYWSKKYEQVTLSAEEYKKVIEVMCPHFHIIPKIRLDVLEDEKESSAKEDGYIKLTDYQHALLKFLGKQSTAVVSGVSGSGKTMLAVETAKRLAASEGPVLFLCLNSHLKKYLDKTAAMPGAEYHTEGTLKMMLTEMGKNGENWKYQDVIVDEAHGFNSELIDELYSMTMEMKGSFYAFYNNEKYTEESQLPAWIKDAECRLVLKQNFGK